MLWPDFVSVRLQNEYETESRLIAIYRRKVLEQILTPKLVRKELIVENSRVALDQTQFVTVYSEIMLFSSIYFLWQLRKYSDLRKYKRRVLGQLAKLEGRWPELKVGTEIGTQFPGTGCQSEGSIEMVVTKTVDISISDATAREWG
jgi:hypothetical protein